MPVTRQTSRNSGSDADSTTRTSRSSQSGKVTQREATDTARSTNTTTQTDDYAFTISFALKMRDAIPCQEIPAS